MIPRFLSILFTSLILLLFCFEVEASEQLSSSGKNLAGVQCIHYWEKGDTLVPSGKTVGQDVGDPPDETYKHYGTYLCQTNLSKEEALAGKYLFIGEVGDASYVQVTKVNGQNVKKISIDHGLSPESESEAVYMRYIPFFVPIRDLYVEDGEYEFKIRYKDLIPLQVGIRSGAPTLESFSGVIGRALKCSPAFTFHVFQIVSFLLLGVSFLIWPKILLKNRFVFVLASVAAGTVILQVSAIPRSFVSPIWAQRLNDFSQILSFPFLSAALLVFFRPKDSKNKRNILWGHVLSSVAAVGFLLTLEKFDRPYIVAYGISLLFLGGIPCLALGLAIRWKTLLFTAGPRAPMFFSILYAVLGILYFSDIVNLVLLGSRYYYFNHYLFFSSIVFSIWYLQSTISPNEVKLRNDLELFKRKAYGVVASRRKEEGDTLAVFAKELAILLSSKRISIQELVDGRLKFVGYFGNYEKTQGLHEIKTPSLIEDAIKTRSIQCGHLVSTNNSKIFTDVIVIPLETDSNVIGVLCFTDFVTGSVPQFLRDRMEIIKNECEPLLCLLISERHNRSKDKLIQMMRNRTHPLQLSSEDYFLKNFDISPSLQSHAFIYGDLVGSVELNERYGESRAVEKVLDEYLALAWERYKHLGVVISRTKGDLVSFVVPNQSCDSSDAQAVIRCYEILQYLAKTSSNLQFIGRSHGIALPLRFRFALSVVPKPLRATSADESLKSFNLLIDEAIDVAARIVSGVALDGECLVMEAAYKHLSSESSLMELNDQRVKGKSIPVKLWTLNGNILQNVA